MLEIFIWLGIIVLFIVSFIGVFVPIIPSVIAIWLGFIGYHFFINAEKLGWLFWLMMAAFTILLIVVDFLMNRYYVGKFGGSKWSEWGAIIGVVIGVFVYPPLGIIVVPFLLVLMIELLLKRPIKEALFVAIGALVAFLSSTFAKVMMQTVMIILFFIFILFF